MAVEAAVTWWTSGQDRQRASACHRPTCENSYPSAGETRGAVTRERERQKGRVDVCCHISGKMTVVVSWQTTVTLFQLLRTID